MITDSGAERVQKPHVHPSLPLPWWGAHYTQWIVVINPRFSGLKVKLRRAWANRKLTCDEEQRPPVEPNSRPSIKGEPHRKKYN